MPNKTCRRVTIRLYNPEIIRVIEGVPRGLRSAVIQSALAAYISSGNHHAFINDLCSVGGLMKEKVISSQEKRDVFTQLTGDF